jgi:hypothetical protein
MEALSDDDNIGACTRVKSAFPHRETLNIKIKCHVFNRRSN